METLADLSIQPNEAVARVAKEVSAAVADPLQQSQQAGGRTQGSRRLGFQ